MNPSLIEYQIKRSPLLIQPTDDHPWISPYWFIHEEGITGVPLSWERGSEDGLNFLEGHISYVAPWRVGDTILRPLTNSELSSPAWVEFIKNGYDKSGWEEARDVVSKVFPDLICDGGINLF
jgi:hypothetical protein